jgi:S1-C subfamily serine protease
MLKLLTAAFFALSIVFTPIQANSSEDQLVQALAATQRAREVVLKLVSLNPVIRSSCSAVVVAPARALTANHCIDIPDMALELNDGSKLAVTVALPDLLGRDLALLIVPDLKGPYAQTTDSRVERDETLYAVGYPFGLGNVLTIGFLQLRVYNLEDGQWYLLSTTHVAPGNSGGGLFVIRDGIPYLVGITVAHVGSPHIAASVELP